MLLRQLEKNLNDVISQGHLVHPHYSTFTVHLGSRCEKNSSWRLILDLSSPKDQSVNEHIPKDAFSVTFNTLDDTVNMVKKLGKGPLMGKVDIKYAFQLMTVHPEDWNLAPTGMDNISSNLRCLLAVVAQSLYLTHLLMP